MNKTKGDEMEQKPSIGRIVHYFEDATPTEGGGTDFAGPMGAVITEVHSDDCVNLRVFTDDDQTPSHVTSVMRKDGGQWSPCWDWPQRV